MTSDPIIRWMIRRDMPEVLAIENTSFEFPWSEEDFLSFMRQRNCIGMVAEDNSCIRGFTVYELHKSRLHLLNFAVDPDYRGEGVGSVMISKLIGKLSQQRREKIITEVRESNLEGQLFLKNQGFKAMSVLRDWYEDTNEDAYNMVYSIAESVPSNSISEYVPHNRITKYIR